MDNYYEMNYGSFVGSKKGYCGFRNDLRVKKFTKLINPQKSDSVLEIGCNKGLLLQNLHQYSKRVTGIDTNKELIDALDNNMIKLMSATDMKFLSNSFDKVCAFEIIEHISEIGKAFSEASRVLKPNGKLFISFPFEIFRGQTAILDACVVYKNPCYATKLHVHRLTPRKIKKIISDLPLAVIESKIMFIPSPSFVMVFSKK